MSIDRKSSDASDSHSPEPANQTGIKIPMGKREKT
jgi:hypothetical protein